MEKRHRSPSYPPLSLREAVERVGMLYSSIGAHPTSREVLAKGLGYSGISGASATTIGALNKYGLIEGRGDEVRVSDRAMAILHPHGPEEKLAAVRAAAMEPELFREIGERFPGRVPNDELLRNYLIRNKFLPQAVDAAISAYKETIEFVESQSGDYDSALAIPFAEPLPMQPANSTTPSPQQNIALVPLVGEKRLGRWDFETGGFVEIRATSDVDTEEALDMIETLVDLKRKELTRKRKQEEESSKGD